MFGCGTGNLLFYHAAPGQPMPISMTPTPETIDLLIEARWIATVESDETRNNFV